MEAAEGSEGKELLLVGEHQSNRKSKYFVSSGFLQNPGSALHVPMD